MHSIAKTKTSLIRASKSLGLFSLVLVLSLSTLLTVFKVSKAHADTTIYQDATVLNLSGDDEAGGAYDLPFNFDFYGQTYAEFYASTNGAITFGHQNSDYPGEDLTISPSGLGDPAIFPFWTDLDSYDYNTIETRTTGTTGSREFIIQYSNHGDHDGYDVMPFTTMQVILYESTNAVQLQYRYLLGGDKGRGGGNDDVTVGISNGNDKAKQFLYNQPLLENGKAIRFTPDGDGDYTMNSSATYEDVYLRAEGQPDYPEISTPNNGATGVSTTTDLTWETTDEATSYDVFVSKTPEFGEDDIVDSTVEHEGPVQSTNFQPSNLEPEQTYYWFVVANDDLDIFNDQEVIINSATHTREISQIASFTTADRTLVSVSNCDELAAVDDTDENIAARIVLTQDIDCSGVENFVPLGRDEMWSNVDGGFNGIFDGQNHRITNLTIDAPNDGRTGLFSEAQGAEFKNINLASGSITGADSTGGILGYGKDVQFTNIQVGATVNGGGGVGGVAGFVRYYNEFRDVDTIQRLSTTGPVNAESDGAGLFGGFEVYPTPMGAVHTVAIDQSTSSSDISSNEADAGGLLGWAYIENMEGSDMPAVTDIIRNSYATGTISAGTDNAGGLVGWVDVGNDDYENNESIFQIDRSYASGQVSASETNAGGLIGYIQELQYPGEIVKVTKSFATGAVSADSGDFGLIGSEDYLDGGELQYEDAYFNQTATGQSVPSYESELSGWTAINQDPNADDYDPSYFKNNSTHPPLNSWDFEDIWLANTGFPLLQNAGSQTAPAPDEVTLDSAETGNPITLAQSGCSEIASSSTNKHAAHAVKDAAYTYPVGFVGFQLTGCPDGGTATVTVTFTGDFDLSKIAVRKYNSLNNSYTTLTSANSGLVLSKTTLEGKAAVQAVYQIVDNGVLDQDSTVGTITDPVGIASAVVSVPNTGLRRL